MISIRFFRPDDEAAMQGNVVAEFVVSVPVEEWGGTLDGRGRVIRSSEGPKKVIWPRHNITGRYHATPQPHDSIQAANAWILARCEEWQGRGRG
jgi:hypothetical protein